MSFLSTFNPNDYSTNTFDALPKGDYEVVITSLQEKTTKTGTGKYFSATFQVVVGTYEGRLLWANYNVLNPSKEAEKIGRTELADLLRAVNKSGANDPTELENLSLIVSVDLDKEDNTKNRIKRYKQLTGNATIERREQAKSATESAPSDKPLPPWKKK